MRNSLLLATIMLGAACGEAAPIGGIRVDADALKAIGKEWPLTVDHAYVRCERLSVNVPVSPDSPGFLVITINGRDYGLNGAATTKGYAKLEEVRPSGNVGGLLDIAKRQCR